MSDEQVHGVNEVRLRGRVSGAPAVRTLPSGDEIVTFRLVVARPQTRKRTKGTPTIDTIDISCWSSATRRRAQRLDDGVQVAVSGALRRRFWRTPGATASRTEVEAHQLERL